jgi:hypothetical protein
VAKKKHEDEETEEGRFPFIASSSHGETTPTATVSAAEKDRRDCRDPRDVGEAFGKE